MAIYYTKPSDQFKITARNFANLDHFNFEEFFPWLFIEDRDGSSFDFGGAGFFFGD